MAKSSNKDEKPLPSKRGGSADKADRGAYLVLARKYRPSNFDELIGQAAMVETLRKAFASNRIAQGYMLSGVRGVGKTTTARILARALNYETKSISEPTIDIKSEGEHCTEIMAGTHVDVLEMDAASHTGVDDIREIIEAARYKPMTARYKVYIIDEVHMLSKSAFNALLKTLEEPPPHVKFIFATTELRKVPVTVLSRCQRFDLRRIEIKDLENHFTKIAKAEKIKIDDAAISLIARAAEGSVRDGLSLLDQAFARSTKASITGDEIRTMLGLADQAEIVKLLRLVLKGEAARALKCFTEFYEKGGEPRQIIAELAATVHLITKTKALGGEADTSDIPEAVSDEITLMAQDLSMAVLHRAWQALLKGYDEIALAANQVSAAEMVILRLLYMANLPSPGEIIAAIDKLPQEGPESDHLTAHSNETPAPIGGAPQSKMRLAVNAEEFSDAGAPFTAPGPQGEQSALPEIAPKSELAIAPNIESFIGLIDLISEKRDMKLKMQLEEYAELVSFAPNRIELHLIAGADDNLARDLSTKLRVWTGENWMIALSHERGTPTISSVRREQEQSEFSKIQAHPLVKNLLEQFPDAEITDIKPLKPDENS